MLLSCWLLLPACYQAQVDISSVLFSSNLTLVDTFLNNIQLSQHFFVSSLRNLAPITNTENIIYLH